MKDNENLSDDSSSYNKSQFSYFEGDTSLMLDNQIKNNPIYDPFSDEKICCIELVNNNKLYIRYEDDWTIEDIVSAVVVHSEFRKLYPKKEWLFYSKHFLALFDLHLILYRSIKSEIETKIDFDIKLKHLNELGLMKNFKFPFFMFKDNRNSLGKIGSQLQNDPELLEIIQDSKELFFIYQNYLPRSCPFDLLNVHPDIEEFHHLKKKAVNRLNRIYMDPLISEKENLDWFIYDDESLNFLTEMEKTEFIVNEVVKTSSKNDYKIYFQDKYNSMLLSNKEYKNFYIVLNLSDMSMKVDCLLTSTPNDLLIRINSKLKKIKPELCFDVKEKILKVSSLNDFVLDMDEPIGKLAYINECIKNNKVPEYWIIENPFMSEPNDFSDFSKISVKYTSMHSNHQNQTFDEIKRSELFSCSNFRDEMSNQILFKKQSSKILSNTIPEENKKMERIFNIASHIPNISLHSKKRSLVELRSSKILENKLSQSNLRVEDPINLFMKNLDEIVLKQYSDKFDDLNKEEVPDREGSFFLNISPDKKEIKESIYLLLIKESTPTKNKVIFQTDTIPIEKYLKAINDPINISELDRPFSIFLNSFQLSKSQYSSFDQKSLIIGIKIQLYCGSQAFSNPRRIKWKGLAGDKNIFINRRIFFALEYRDLPIFTSMLIKLKLMQYDRNNDLVKVENIAWTNFRLFDHNRQLKTGKN